MYKSRLIYSQVNNGKHLLNLSRKRQNQWRRTQKGNKKDLLLVFWQLVETTTTCNWPITPSALSFYPLFHEIRIQLFVNVAEIFFPTDLLPVLCCPAVCHSSSWNYLEFHVKRSVQPQRLLSSVWSPGFCTKNNISKHTYTITFIIYKTKACIERVVYIFLTRTVCL